MKEFNNYIKKEYPHINSGDTEFGFDVWKAALEYVLEHSETTGLCNHPVCTNTINIIEEELNNDKETK